MASRNRFAQTYLFSTAGIVAMAVLLIGVNVIVGALGGRVDLTEGNLYTLSGGTKTVLKGLESPVKINFYYSSEAKQMPMMLKNYARRVDDLLKEYNRVGGDNIRVQHFNPEPLSDAADAAQLDGVRGQETGMGETIYFGISVQQLEETVAIPFLNPQREDMLEYELTRAIYRVAHPQKTVIGIMSSLPVMGRQMPPMMMGGGSNQNQPPWRVVTELRKSYEVREVPMDTTSIPGDIDALVAIHPKQVSDDTWFALDQYVLNGGRLLALIDPMSTADAQNSNPMMAMQQGQPGASTLGPLLDAWGLTMSTEDIVADLVYATRVQDPRNGRPLEMPTILSLTGDAISQENPATADLESILVGFGGVLKGEGVPGLAKEVLLATSTRSDLVEKFQAQVAPESVKKSFTSSETEYPLAVLLRGTFPTAFPDGRPSADDAEESDDDDTGDSVAGEESSSENWLTASVGDSAVIVITDTDIAYDDFCVQTHTVFGQQFAVPISDNLTLLHNLVDLLAGDTSLMNIRSRGAINRPFEVVNELRAEAEQNYQAKITRLESELAQVQQRLSELQQGRAEGANQKYILSPEQMETIKNYRTKEAQTRKELREVQKQLLKDIDALETGLKWANIALMPALVGLGGIVLAIVKRRREVRK
ncbi:MAG: Gldg family protein [Candidatus Pacebacteria bacterium]|nr:Gldg family protein [Candidatus Paceibacterota bacterium]